MALLGNGAVAIWHDIAEEGRADFYAWHGREHMPERVGIPGFRRGRRYEAIQADLEYFNLYETDSTSVLTGPDYRARLESPTPWTQSAVKHFRRVARSLCQVVESVGHGQGGLVGVWRYDIENGQAAGHAEALHSHLAGIRESAFVAGTHLLIADTEASGEANAEERARSQRNDVPGAVLIVEGWGDLEPFAELCRTRLSTSVFLNAGVSTEPVFGLYRLQATVAETDV